MTTTKRPVWSWTDAVAAADVPPYTKLVCYNIARYLSSAGKGWCIPIKDMMAETGIGNKALAVHLANAEAAGLIIIKRQHDRFGRRSVTQYVPRFPDGTELAKEPAQMAGASKTEPAAAQSLSVPRTPRKVRRLSVSRTSGQGGRLSVARTSSPSVVATPQVSTFPSQSSQKGKTGRAIQAADALAGLVGDIPFYGTDAREALLVGKAIAFANRHGTGETKRLPFSAQVLNKIANELGVDLEMVHERYQQKTAGRTIKDPSAYLLSMARDEAAKAAGVTTDLFGKLSGDAKAKQEALQELAASIRAKAKGEPADWRQSARQSLPRRAGGRR